MNTATQNEGRKWINTGVALTAILVGYVFLSFEQQLNEWFELEAKISNFLYLSQGIAVLLGLGVFIALVKNEKSASFLNETYGEMVKVVWPDRSETARHTVGIIIGVTIAGFVFGIFDFLASTILSYINS